MEINREIYIPTKKDMAYLPMPGYPKANQWWYYDAVFDNGYTMNMAWRCTDLQANIILEIMDPDGKVVGKRVKFPRNKVIASTEVHDITMGANRIYGEYPKYYSNFQADDVGEKLVYDCTVQEFKEPPDGCYIGRGAAPATPRFFAYVLRPRCKVSGTLIVNGKKIPVKGEGYCDHQWGNCAFPEEAVYYWYWSRAFLPQHTIFWWESQLDETMATRESSGYMCSKETS